LSLVDYPLLSSSEFDPWSNLRVTPQTFQARRYFSHLLFLSLSPIPSYYFHQ